MINSSKDKGEVMHTTECTLCFSNILDNWNRPRREEKWRSVTMLLNWPVLDSVFQTRLMWGLFMVLGRWKVDVHQNQTEVYPSSSGPGGGTVEASLSTWGQSNWAVWTILWSWTLWDYSTSGKTVEILKNYLQKFASIKAENTHCAFKDDLSSPRGKITPFNPI